MGTISYTEAVSISGGTTGAYAPLAVVAGACEGEGEVSMTAGFG